MSSTKNSLPTRRGGSAVGTGPGGFLVLPNLCHGMVLSQSHSEVWGTAQSMDGLGQLPWGMSCLCDIRS